MSASENVGARWRWLCRRLADDIYGGIVKNLSVINRFLLVGASLLAISACKESAPSVAVAAVAAEASTKPAHAPVAVVVPAVINKLITGMPYAEMRKDLLAEGWLPLRDPKCWENAGSHAALCNALPEAENCSADGHCVMNFASDRDRAKLHVVAYGPYERWNKAGEESSFQVKSWDLLSIDHANASADASDAAQCPSQDFDTFLQSFASDEKVRLAFTAPLVKVAEIEDRGDEGYFKRMVYIAGSAYRDFNVVYDHSAFHFYGGDGKPDSKTLSLKIIAPMSEVREVRYVYGSSEGNSYRFENKGGCWHLTEDPESPQDP